MTGATLQLHSEGDENTYLTKNPQISFFKSVYKHISSFAMQSIDLHFEKVTQLSYNSTTKLKLTFGKNGDLIHKLFLQIPLPAIQSIKIDGGPSPQLKWSPNIGEIIVQNARVLIGGEEVESFDSEYMHIYNRQTSTSEKNDFLDHMYAKNETYTSPKFYRSSSVQGTSVISGKTYVNPSHHTIPGIPETTVTIPLPFWFHREIGQSLPISNLTYHDAILEIELRPLKELLVGIEEVLPISSDNSIKHLQVKSVSDLTTINVNTKVTLFNYFKNKTWNISPVVQTLYIFLDKDLQKQYKHTMNYVSI